FGDVYEFTAEGEIWAGVELTGNNGPEGWDDIASDLKFPFHTTSNAHPFALIGKLGPNGAWFSIGRHRPKERYLGHDERPIVLRTNDDMPGNGSGAFTCRVQVWRPRPIHDTSWLALLLSDKPWIGIPYLEPLLLDRGP